MADGRGGLGQTGHKFDLSFPAKLPIPALSDPSCADYFRSFLEAHWQLQPESEQKLAAKRIGFLDSVRQSFGDAWAPVVFLAPHHGNFPSLEYFAEYLKSQGIPSVAIYVQNGAPAQAFTHAFDCEGSLFCLAQILSELSAESFFVQAHGRWAFLAQFAQTLAPQTRVVQEFWDWMHFFVENGEVDESKGVEESSHQGEAGELALALHSEVFAKTRLDGVVYKNGGQAIETLLRDSSVPVLRTMPCPPASWMKRPKSKLEPAGPDLGCEGSHWSLVHAGQLKGRTSSRARFGDLQYFSVIDALSRQNISLCAYVGAGGGSFSEAYGDYLELADENPLFAIRSRRPVRQLIGELNGNFHFGSLLYHFDADLRVGREHLRGAIASKLFTYLASGLPVLVSEELEFMAELVREHRIGLVLSRTQIEDLRTVLDEADYPALLLAVADAQKHFCYEAFAKPLLELCRGDA